MAKTAIGTTFRIQGQTSAAAAIASVTDVTFYQDGSVSFTANGQLHTVYPTGAFAALLRTIFAGGTGPGHLIGLV